MKIDIKWIIGILGTILMGLSTWVLVSVVELKEDSSMIKGELFQINQNFGRVYNYINNKWNIVSTNYTWVFVACYKTANVSTMKEKKQ